MDANICIDDANGNRTSLVSTVGGAADFQNQYGYDTRNNATLVEQSAQTGFNNVAAKRVDLTYYADGSPKFLYRSANLLGNAFSLTRSYYDADGRLTRIWTTGLVSKDFQWQYDKANRVTQFVSPDGTQNYTYDASGQLKTNSLTTESYTYDSNGNRTNTGYSTMADNRLASDGTYTYIYDNEGNLRQRTSIATGDARIYTYDYRQRLVAVADYLNYAVTGLLVQFIHYTYDVNNLRTAKAAQVGYGTPAVTDYVYDNGEVVLEFDPGATAPQRFLYGPAVDQILAAEKPGGVVLWTLTDNLGTVRYLFDSSGNIVDHIKYDSFGNVTTETAPTTHFTFGYTGAVFDVETGMQYHRARYYDPATARWITEDPIEADPNSYRYADNSPTNATDPSGLDFIAIGDRAVFTGGQIGVGFHYSIEYWKSECPAPSPAHIGLKSTGFLRYTLTTLTHGGRMVDSVELLTSTGWTAWFQKNATSTGHWYYPRRVSVWIAYISKGTSTATKLEPIQDGVTKADWDNVVTLADEYNYAEHPVRGAEPTGKLSHWPSSNYFVFGTNSNTFVRWVVPAAGWHMYEMTGNHPGDWTPQLNTRSDGTYLTNPPPYRG